MSTILKIPHTIDLLCKCWNQAELESQREIAFAASDSTEEQITFLFTKNFAERLKKSSENGAVSTAFYQDLVGSFPMVDKSTNVLKQISNGLIAELSPHERQNEAHSGGDIGLQLIRPSIKCHVSTLKIDFNNARGLLVQAKLKNSNNNWGELTTNQEVILPEKTRFLAILLYSYRDVGRHLLNCFTWQLCNGNSIEKIEDWLKNDEFPSLVDSCRIISDLGTGMIGTSDAKEINKFITPKKNKSLIIRIFWPDDKKRPRSEVFFVTKHEFKETAKPMKIKCRW
jgi:hypothetical protein